MERGLLPPLAANDRGVLVTTGARSGRRREYGVIAMTRGVSRALRSAPGRTIATLSILVLLVGSLAAQGGDAGTGGLGPGSVDSGSVDPGSVDRGSVDRGDMNRGDVDRGQAGPVAADRTARPDRAPRTVGDYYGNRGRAARGNPESAEVAVAEADEASSMVGRYLRVLGWLVVVVGLAVATLMLIKRLAQRGGHVPGVGRLLEVVARLPVTGKHQILVVRVGGRALLVGISPDGMRTLCELDDTRDLLATARGSNFEDRLSNASEPYKGTPDIAEAEMEDNLAPYRREVDRLKSMVGNWRMSASQAGGGS